MKIRLLLLSILACSLLLAGTWTYCNGSQFVEIANESDQPVGINYSIPEYTEALILLKQNNTTVVHDSIEQVKHITSEDKILDRNNVLWTALLKQAITVEQFGQSGFSALNKASQIIEIVNNSAQPLHLNFLIPVRTEGLVWLRSIKSVNAQEMLHEAILNDSADGVRQAVRMGANVDLGKDNQLPLLWAGLFKKHNALGALLECDAIPNQDIKLGDACTRTPLTLAISSNNEHVVELLLKYGANPNQTIRGAGSIHTPLTWAISSNNKQIIKLLLEYGASPNQITKNGYGNTFSPLMRAISRKDIQAVKILLNANADVNFKVSQSTTGMISPISLAIDQGCEQEMIELLLTYGAKL